MTRQDQQNQQEEQQRGLAGPPKENPKPDASSESKTTLPYYGKRKLD